MYILVYKAPVRILIPGGLQINILYFSLFSLFWPPPRSALLPQLFRPSTEKVPRILMIFWIMTKDSLINLLWLYPLLSISSKTRQTKLACLIGIFFVSVADYLHCCSQIYIDTPPKRRSRQLNTMDQNCFEAAHIVKQPYIAGKPHMTSI